MSYYDRLSRLSDLNIKDDIIRAYLYRTIIDAINNLTVECANYEIKADEAFRADLVSYRIYGTVEAKWLVMLLCDVEQDFDPLPVGTDILFPPADFIREQIRHFAENGEIKCLD